VFKNVPFCCEILATGLETMTAGMCYNSFGWQSWQQVSFSKDTIKGRIVKMSSKIKIQLTAQVLPLVI